MEELTLRNALPTEGDAVLSLYRSVLGEEFCVWNEYYPSRLEIDADLASEGLFVLCQGERILGAVSLVPENELDDCPGWTVTEGAREIARVVIAGDARGRGLGGAMVSLLLERLRQNGVPAVHLSAAVKNIPALRTYEKLGFRTAGRAALYGGDYFLLEKDLC